MPVWTDDQLRVIHSGAKEILCAAAAGSGKTAVLVERIVRLISEGADPEEFLVVTFTNAAAAEMKEKIRNRLLADRKKPEIRNALDKIEYMQVSTIHSFCQKLIRDQFQFLELDPFFQICDTSQRKQLFHDAFRDACEQLQKEQDQDFLFYKKMFTGEVFLHTWNIVCDFRRVFFTGDKIGDIVHRSWPIEGIHSDEVLEYCRM